MSLIVELSILAIVFLSTYAAYEVRLMRQIAEATRLHDQILVMARGRLWAKYPGARFDIITSTTFSRNKLIASLIMYTGKRNGGWVLLVKTRRGHHDIPQALEDLYEELAICIIKNEDEIKQAFDDAIPPLVRGGGYLDNMIPQRKVPYIDQLDGSVITKCAAM